MTVRCSAESVTFAMPKSVTFTWSPGSIMMFAGLMSRWTTLCLWAKARASATCAPIEAARSTDIFPDFATTRSSPAPSTNSIEM